MKKNDLNRPYVVDGAEGLIYFNGMSMDCVRYIMERFDNYYDANGLIMYDIHTVTLDQFFVDFEWNHIERLPSDEEFTENLERWFEAFLRMSITGDL
jgi:hypothetical protein